MTKKITIIGAGPGGYAAAIRAARLGAQVTIIENHRVGGTCLNYGCIPSKIMKHTAEMMNHFKNAAELGLSVSGDIAVDIEQLQTRKRNVIQIQEKGMRNTLSHEKINFVNGDAYIEPSKKGVIKVKNSETDEVQYDKLILSVGSKPLSLPGMPFDGDKIISTNEVFNLNQIPKSLLIIGGGVIGCEFAFIFSSLGSKVTVIEAMSRLLPIVSVDEDCSKILQREMKKRKISFHVDSIVKGVSKKDGKIVASVGPSGVSDLGSSKNEKLQSIEVDQVMVCVGRQPVVAPLGLKELGVKMDEKSWVITDDFMATSAPDVYAIGDMLGPSKIMLAHVASTEGTIAAENAMGNKKQMQYDVVPGAIFTMPEVANVGLTESQAIQKGINAKSDAFLFRNIGKAHVLSEISGQAKIVSDNDSGKILGVHIIGPHATDLISEGVLAVKSGITVKEMAETIHAHPTLAEIIMETSLKAIGY